MKQRLHVFAGGYVQGVGFRATVRDFARTLSVTGWVKNLTDGRVEMEFEGDNAVLQQLLQNLRNYFRDYLTALETTEIAVQDSANFQIRF